jgi:hypothetical protein
MKQKGNCLVGDPIALDNFTSGWESVRLHPTIFYRRLDQFRKGLKKINGLYVEIDMGQFIMIRFSEKDDLTEFHRLHHEYL